VNKRRVLIICTGNSARSRMAEALLRHEAGDLYEVFSAGTHPVAIRTETVAVMREISVECPCGRKPSDRENTSAAPSVMLQGACRVRTISTEQGV
jgi:arsenate reductase